MRYKYLLLVATIFALCQHKTAAQSQPYLFPEEIAAIEYQAPLKPQIQSFSWTNLGRYEKAKAYYDQTMGKRSPISNAAFQDFYQLEKVDAKDVILQAAEANDVVMFNTSHHIPVTVAYVRKLLPELKNLGFTHITIEGFDEDKISEEGLLKVVGGGYHHEPQFMKMIRTALHLGFSVHGYVGSCVGKGEDCSREQQQARQIAALYEKEEVAKILVVGGYDHINEREDHPYWGKAMAAAFKEMTGTDPLTIEQADMLYQSEAAFNDPYRQAIGLVNQPVVLQHDDGTNWLPPGGDRFDIQVFHPRERYYKGVAGWELAAQDRVLHLDSLIQRQQQSVNLEYPVIAHLYIKEEWDRLKEQAAPYDVTLISDQSDSDNHLIVPSSKALHLKLRSREEEDIDLDITPLEMAATLVKGAQIFSGTGWVEKDFYLVDGAIREEIAGEPMDTIELTGKYITPGFADGHTHNLDRSWQTYMIDQYLAEGTLYIQNLTSKSKGVRKFREILSTQPSPRVKYSNWGFTSTLGHPFTAYEPYAMGLNDPSAWGAMADSIRKSRLDLYNSYAFVDNASQLDSIWPAYLQTDPDLTKIYYFNEEGIEDQQMGAHGLRLEVAQAIIDSAHAANLSVYAHINDREDFEKMLEAGIDGFAHMPGLSWHGDSTDYDKYYLPDATLYEAAKRGVVLNPTAGLAQYRMDEAALDTCARYQYDLISRYRNMGGKIIIGSDMFGSTASKVYEYYAKNFPMSEESLLSLISTETAMAIFPAAAVGKISHGFSADFLVFDQPPIRDKSIARPEKVFVEGKLAFQPKGQDAAEAEQK